MMKKNLLYINFSKGWGGLEIFSYKLFNWLSGEGWEIVFLAEDNSKLYKNLIKTKYKNKIIPLKT